MTGISVVLTLTCSGYNISKTVETNEKNVPHMYGKTPIDAILS